MSYSTIEKGTPYSLDYRIYIVDSNGVHVSPFHDIPLYADKDKCIFNMVVEIPRWTNAKMEICREERLNPIKQDVKNGKVRFVHNCYPHHGYIWNYGALPQTWEDPLVEDSKTNLKGDNDPIDVCEIGFRIKKRGEVIQVKILGVLGLIDEGETDWKLIAIDIKDPMAPLLNDIEDVDTHMPGFLDSTRNWFRVYKIPSGKPENKFALEGQIKNQDFAIDVIEQAHYHWLKLAAGESEPGEISLLNSSLKHDKFKACSAESRIIIEAMPEFCPEAEIPEEVSKWEFV